MPEELSEKAYELNRQGMIDMAEAKFEEAILLFQQASRIKSDYEISGRALLYTPTFMTAWAYEKTGDSAKACETFQLFNNRSGALAEPTKKAHADQFIKNHCN
jgi:tetratricopeptide (TPR) repeat protein